MQLKSVKLVGFKSFVDPTTIHIKDGMNGVVGPNGCGKSNIIDAVRWVIGERSAKQLRGQSMSDVIFNGTSGRKPVGRASVELIFDNSDGRIVGEYAKFSEIAVKREVFREGQSNYYLNGANCRRQDIVDLFYGTGLGSRSYAIIEQGMISRLIEAKPEDLRNHIEEAAGIAKYKQRRRDTENRMKRTEENLSRLIDLRDELDKQLRHLQRQANAAERYKVLREEERGTNSQIKALHWQALQEKFVTYQSKIEHHANEHERIRATQSSAETELEKARLSHTDATDQHNDAQKAFYTLGNDVSQIEQKIRYTKEQLERWESELELTRSRWDELSDSTTDYEQQIEEINAEVDALRPHANSLSEAFRESAEALALAERDMQVWNDAWDQSQTRLAETHKTVEVNRTKLSNYQQNRQNIIERTTRLKESRSTDEQAAVQADIAPLADQLNDYKQDLEQRNEALSGIREDIQTKKSVLEALQNTLNDKRASLQTKEGRKASLEALQEAAFASDDAAVTHWLTEHGIANHPRLGKDLQVDSGWEVAVETVLKGMFDAVCIDNLENFIANFSPLESGELVLVESPSAQSSASHSATTLSDKVRSEWPVAQWLGNIMIAESLEQAKAMRHQLAEHQSVITKDGVWLGKHWLRVAKAVNNDSSVLLREQELQSLINAISTLKNELFGYEEDLVREQEGLAALESNRETLHQNIQALNRDITSTQSQLTAKQTRYDALMQREQSISQELVECQQRHDTFASQIEDAERLLAQHQSGLDALLQERESLLAKKQAVVSSLNDKREKAQATKQRADEYDIRLTSNENQLSILKQTLDRDERQLEQLSERRDALTTQLESNDNPLAVLEEQLQAALALQSDSQQSLSDVTRALEDWNQKIATLEKTKTDCQYRFDQMQTAYQQLQMDQQAVSVRQTTIKEQLEEADFSLDAVIEGLPEAANLVEWEQQSEKLAQRITRLGPINLAAIEEHDTLVARKDYIDKQHADLEEALAILTNAIHKIDKETRSKFKSTFDKVNESFKTLFPKVFGGGSASLELDNEDFLSAGVMVKAQPPGKRNSTIHMLSGGEKALTAIALVFGLFQLNPAPFCILDEVDAPLDDLNVGRYCRLISEMATKIQFIVISHNKVTIEACHRLMGITMQEPGVSRVVSVDIDEAVSLVEA